MFSFWQIYLLCVAISGSGFVAQTLISGFWSTVFNEDSIYYSINLAFYFGGMGVGSLLATWIPKVTERLVVRLVVGLLVLIAIMVPVLRVSVSWLGNREFVPLFLVIIAGMLAGASIPLVLRLRVKGQSIRLGTVFLIDYGSAFFFALLFNLYLLSTFGYQRTALCCFGVGTVLCLPAVYQLGKRRAVGSFGLLAGAVVLSSLGLSRWGMNPDPKAASVFKVLYQTQSPYQKIVLTEELGTGAFAPDELHKVLYLDGMVQFSSIDETSYHLCLANIPLTAREFFGGSSRRALILGGGDGLAARNLLAYSTVEKVVLVELDPEMIRLAKENPAILKLNRGSFFDKRFSVVNGDAFQWIRKTQEKFDVVLIDFPHPKNLSLARLYSAEFYSGLKRVLSPGGFISIQSGPSYDPSDFERNTLNEISSSILETVQKAGLKGSIYVSPRDQEAFVLATNRADFDMERFAKTVGMFGTQGMALFCQYRSDWKRPPAKVNTLNELALVTYMDRWSRGAAKKNYDFRGVRAAFLPE